jgi:hypothetical protein
MDMSSQPDSINRRSLRRLGLKSLRGPLKRTVMGACGAEMKRLSKNRRMVLRFAL